MELSNLKDFNKKYKNKRELLIESGDLDLLEDFIKKSISALKNVFKNEIDFLARSHIVPDIKKINEKVKSKKRKLRNLKVGDLSVMSQDNKGEVRQSETKMLSDLISLYMSVPSGLEEVAELYVLDQGVEDLLQANHHIEEFYQPVKLNLLA